MSGFEIALTAMVGGAIGAMLLDARFWWSFVQEVYYHHPGNHPCERVGCCR